jgi:hypothetical protein
MVASTFEKVCYLKEKMESSFTICYNKSIGFGISPSRNDHSI